MVEAKKIDILENFLDTLFDYDLVEVKDGVIVIHLSDSDVEDKSKVRFLGGKENG